MGDVRSCRGARLALVILLAAGASGCGLQQLWQPSRRQILDRILPSSVQIVIEQREGRRLRTGSGVAIASKPTSAGIECVVLTAGHTVADLVDRGGIYVLFGRRAGAGTKVPATVIAYQNSPDLDVAVLSATTEQCAPAPATSPPALGEPVWVVAFPWGGDITLATGVVSQIRTRAHRGGEPTARFMIDALVGYGASGSGVYQANSGRLLGIVEGYGTARVAGQGGAPNWYIDVPMPGQTFVTPLSDVQRYLRKTGHGDLLAIAD